MELSKFERLSLSNQFKILEVLYPNEAEYYRRYRRIVEDGYTMHYGDFSQHIADETPMGVCEEVLNVLDMYSNLLVSWQDLKDKGGIEEREVRFPGFDGNNETYHLGYCEFFLNELGRFDELHRDGYNSHARMLPKYRAMLAEYAKVRGAGLLSAEQIQALIAARPD